jgi:hypothetical protein
MEFITILELLKDYDVFTIIVGVIVYKQIDKKLTTVDKSVNCRPPGAMTISQEVSEIHRKVDVSATTSDFIMKEFDITRERNEVKFSEISGEIKLLHKRVTNKK